MEQTLVVIGFLAFIGLLAAGDLATFVFYAPLFRFGIPVYSSQASVPPPRASDPARHETEHWVFKVVAQDRVLVRPRMRLFALEPQGVVGTLSWEHGSPALSFRLRLSNTVFLTVWLSVWLVGGVVDVIKDGASAQSLGFVGLGLAITVFVVGWTVGVARSCVPEFLAAYENWARTTEAHA